MIVRGVPQSDYTVTTAVAASLGIHDSTVNHLARTEDCAVLPVDIGMREDTPSGVMPCKVRAGTADICSGSAMSRAECERAIESGIQLIVLVEEALPFGRLDLWEVPVFRTSGPFHRYGDPMTLVSPDALRKACITMQQKYGVKFRFCSRRQSPARIIRYLKGDLK